MAKTIPSYLRVHRGPESADPSPADRTRDLVETFWDTFAEVTGWAIELDQGQTTPPAIMPPIVTKVSEESEHSVEHKPAMRLAESARDLVDALSESHGKIREQDAELAAAAASLVFPLDRERLADDLEATLERAASACGCDAAALYLLDDETEYLSTRAAYGLSPERLHEDPRLLRGSRADLEAMVQGVVTIDDLRGATLDAWHCPETGFDAAICALVQTDDIPIGTLWLLRRDVTHFGPGQESAAQLAAAHVSLLLSTAGSETNTSNTDDDLFANADAVKDVAEWQFDSLPPASELAPGWTADGMIESNHNWATGWHTWDVLPDGSLMVAIAQAIDSTARGAMCAAIARSALTAHSGYRHTPSEMVQRISDTLWQTSAAEQFMSLLYLRIDPETGCGEFAAAGEISAMVASRYGFRPLVEGVCEPLCSDFEARCVADTFRMTAGEVLLAYGPGLDADGASQTILGDGLRTSMQQGDQNPLAALRRRIAGLPVHHERGAVTLLYQPA